MPKKDTHANWFNSLETRGTSFFFFLIIISRQTPYRIVSTHRLLWVKQEISQAVCYQFVVLDIMWL